MRNIYTVAAGLALVGLTGCATTGKFVDKMNGFVGQNEIAVVSRYGSPQDLYTAADGTRVLTYTRGRNMFMPGVVTQEQVRSTTQGTITTQQGLRQTSGTYTAQTTSSVPVQSPGIALSFYCTVRFTISASGVIQSWRAEGNDCTSDG